MNLVSAGGIVYREDAGSILVVVCGRNCPTSFNLPKGTPEPNETKEQTALREVREETGLEVEINGSLGSIDYWFADRERDVRYHKTVHFYLMVPIGGTTDQHDPEFDGVEWFDAQEALKTLAYTNEVNVLQRALDLIEQQEAANPGQRS